jgi:hypothetical protein
LTGGCGIGGRPQEVVGQIKEKKGGCFYGEMNRITFIISTLIILISLFVSARGQAQQISVESIQILRILDQEEKAMVKLPDGRMHILKVGDLVGKNGKVIEIVKGRIVIEEKTDKGPERVIIRFESGKQRIERIRKIGEQPPMLYAPK